MFKKMLFTLLITCTFIFAQVSSSFYWNGSTDTEGKVITGSTYETAGYWYSYDDNASPNNGDSKFIWPANFDSTEFGNFFGPMCVANGGIKGTVQLGTAYEYPFVGLGFNLVSENKEGANVNAWEGICLTYSSDASFDIELGVPDEETVTGYNNYKATVTKSSTVTTINVPWSKFKQDATWGVQVEQSTILSSTNAIKLKFSNSSGEFLIKGIGSLNNCTSDEVKLNKVIEPVKYTITDKCLCLRDDIKSNVYDVNGILINTQTGNINFNNYKPGMYFILTNDYKINFMVK